MEEMVEKVVVVEEVEEGLEGEGKTEWRKRREVKTSTFEMDTRKAHMPCDDSYVHSRRP